MGLAKEHQLEVEERGYDYIGDRWVCSDCLDDVDLKQFVLDHRAHAACTYCGRTAVEPIAMPVDALLDEIADAVFLDWRQIEGSEFFEGEQMVTSCSTDDLFRYELDWPFAHDDLGKDIVEAFEITDWVEMNPLRLRPGEALAAGWEEFSRQIRTVTRYLFFQEPKSYDDRVDPRRVLLELHELINEYGLVTQIERNTPLFRARHSTNPNQVYRSAEDLGAPSSEKAKSSSRMSAAGIPVFYGGLDLDTAIAETLAHAGAGAGAGSTSATVCVSWGTFKTLDPMRVLDLTSLPPVPGFFSTGRRSRDALSFLGTFAAEVARPIPKDGREHIEYAPTQVVAEYLRHAYEGPGGSRLDGILYPSSARDGGTSCVLFLGAESCCDLEDWDGTDEPHRLGLDKTSTGSSIFKVRWEQDSEPEQLKP